MMNNSTTGSMSIGLSKNSIDEDLFSSSDAISNESITKGISISGIYDVISDPIKGGMGSVWKVHHNGWNMDLAMKRPLPKYFAEGSERRKETLSVNVKTGSIWDYYRKRQESSAAGGSADSS